MSPEEIETVSILYGPFSALYAGNSFGGVVNINTRMPEKFEAHASAQTFIQNFELYGTDKTLNGNHQTASVVRAVRFRLIRVVVLQPMVAAFYKTLTMYVP